MLGVCRVQLIRRARHHALRPVAHCHVHPIAVGTAFQALALGADWSVHGPHTMTGTEALVVALTPLETTHVYPPVVTYRVYGEHRTRGPEMGTPFFAMVGNDQRKS